MKNRISKPYLFKKHEALIINSNFINYHDWDKTCFDIIKESIIEHLRVEQDNECCYCKRELGFDIKGVDIEHIVPKSEYSTFTFHPENLALSCPACNTKKSTTSVLFKRIKRYPKKSQNFIIVHAHYDNYSEHIGILEGCVYYPITRKGSETITKCELFRLRVVEENSKAAIARKSPEGKLIEEIRTTNNPESLANLINQFESLVNQLGTVASKLSS